LNRLVALVVRYGVPLISLNVFAEQIGAPIPAVPTLLVAGALTRDGKMSSTHVMVGALIASVIADWIWFLLGRRYGYRILRLLCRISLSPDSCVRDTEANFERWGMKSLLVAKFIPGFSTVAPPLAGATNRGTLEFLIYDATGAFLWAGSAVAAGRVFHHAIDSILKRLESLGGWAVLFVAGVLALWVLGKWWQRMRFIKQLRVARIGAGELKAMFDRGENPVVLDVRTSAVRKRDPRRIPTAIVASSEDVSQRLEDVPLHQEIVLYCT
jgi:membrane protein DedA with SNARE-associated domain